MARPRQTRPAPPNGFIASAARLPPVKRGYVTNANGWQDQAWRHFNSLGEVRFIANWVGNMMSRAVLEVVREESGEYAPVSSGPARDALDAYFGGRSGQAEMLQQTGVNLTVSGEGYHINYGKHEQWLVLSSGSITNNSDTLHFRLGGERVPLAKDDFVSRIWTPHPRNMDEADSPLRSNMAILSEMQQLNAHVSSQLDSRLTGAGILFLPSEIQFAAPEGVDAQSNNADSFMQVLGEVMTTGIKNRESAEAHVPIVVTAPGEVLDKIQYVTFWTPLDAATIQMRDHALKRLAIGMDTPPEILLGSADSNHWNAWLVDESSIKSHLEPRLQVVVNAITTAYLRPAIEDLVPDPQAYSVMADTSQIRLRPNRSSEAIELYDRGELNGPGLRRETGFQEADSLTDDELILWLLRKVATGSTSPEQTVAALAALGADLRETLPRIESTENKEPGDAECTDARRKVVDTRAPDMDRSVQEKDQRDRALVAACEVLVLRALERAGNRLFDARATARELGKVRAHQRHLIASGDPDHLLSGTWEFAEEVLTDLYPQPAAVISVLDMYVRGLLAAKVAHTRQGLLATLSQLDVMV